MNGLLGNAYWLLFLLSLLFWGSAWLRERTGFVLFNPTLVATAAMIVYLTVTDTAYAKFEQAGGFVTFWLQPAVVCLAVPLYVQWQKIKAQWLCVLAAQVVGSCVGIVSGVLLTQALGGSAMTAVSVAAKSVTMPIGIEITKHLGGAVGINTAAVMLAGVLGQMVGIGVFALMGIKNPISKSLAMGTASHAIGIAGMMPFGARFVAYGTVGLIVNGIMTAVLAPIVVPLLI